MHWGQGWVNGVFVFVFGGGGGGGGGGVFVVAAAVAASTNLPETSDLSSIVHSLHIDLASFPADVTPLTFHTHQWLLNGAVQINKACKSKCQKWS